MINVQWVVWSKGLICDPHSCAACPWLHCDAHARHMRTQNKRSSRRAELWILSTHVYRMGLVSGYHLRSSWNPGNSLQYWTYVERETGSSDWAQWVWPDVVEKACKPWNFRNCIFPLHVVLVIKDHNLFFCNVSWCTQRDRWECADQGQEGHTTRQEMPAKPSS